MSPGARWQPGTPAAVVLAEVLALTAVAVTDVCVQRPGPGPVGVAAAVLASTAFLATELVHVLPAARALRDRRWPWTLAAQGLLALGGFPVVGLAWAPMVLIVLSSALVLLPLRVAVPLVALTGPALGLVQGGDPAVVVYTTLSTWSVAAAIWGPLRLGDIAAAVRENRDEVARLAVTAERDRSGRELEAMLGTRLGTLAELARSASGLLPGDPDGAARRSAELVELSRATLREVRDVARGDRGLSLSGQLAAAGPLLDSVGVALRSDLSPGALPPEVDLVLGAVVREAVTGVVRHRSATWCAVTLAVREGRVRLEVTDDATEAAAPGSSALSGRLAGLGGSLCVDRDPAGGYRVVALLPLALRLSPASRPPRPAAPRPAGSGR